MGTRARGVRIAVFATLVALASAGSPAARPVRSGEPPAGRLIVRFRDGTPPTARAAVHHATGARLVRRLADPEFDLVAVTSDRLAAAAGVYRRSAAVKSVEPDYTGAVAMSPSDRCFASACANTNSQWNLWQIGAPLGWETFPGSFWTAEQRRTTQPVKVAVIDTKIDTGHPDFANPGGTADAGTGGQLDLAEAGAFDVPPSGGDTSAAYHGTMVAGIVAAATNNGTDVAGTGFTAQIVPITAVNSAGGLYASSIADAIVYAKSAGARVINLSLGLAGNSDAVHQAIKEATSDPNHPALVVAAAGNNANSTPFYPASYPEVMSVSGVGPNRAATGCSNFNANVSVSAPGGAVTSLAPMPQEVVTTGCGTSAAAPHVAGLAALLFAQNPARTPAEVRSIIERTALDLGPAGRDDHYGFGEIDVDRALHDGLASPVVENVRATEPRNGVGPSTITATATSPVPVTGAEAWFDPGTGPWERVALQPADGAWDGTRENVTGSVTVTSSEAIGTHAIIVRAFGGRWGAGSPGSVVVDRLPPQVGKPSATSSVLGSASVITFTVGDTTSSSTSIEATIIFASDGTIEGHVFRQSVPNGNASLTWTPAPGAVLGLRRVQVFATDDAGNTGSSPVSDPFLVV